MGVLLYGLKKAATVGDWHRSARPKVSPPSSKKASSVPPMTNGCAPCYREKETMTGWEARDRRQPYGRFLSRGARFGMFMHDFDRWTITTSDMGWSP